MDFENVYNSISEEKEPGGVRGGVEKKEEKELKEQIDMKVSARFQIHPSTNS
jgi:hypothetical protein